MHEHTWGTEYVYIDETHHGFECQTCHETTNSGYHDYGQVVITKASTETKTGEGTRTGKVCGHVKTVVVPKEGHFHDYVKGTAKWKKSDYEKYNSYSAIAHWKYCLECLQLDDDGNVISGSRYDTEKHTFGSWLYTPDGKKEYRICDTCDYMETRDATPIPEGYHILQIDRGYAYLYDSYAESDGEPITMAKAGDAIKIVCPQSLLPIGRIYDYCIIPPAYNVQGHGQEEHDSTFYFIMPDNDVYLTVIAKDCDQPHDDATFQMSTKDTFIIEEEVKPTCTENGYAWIKCCAHCRARIYYERSEHEAFQHEVYDADNNAWVSAYEEVGNGVLPTCYSAGRESDRKCKLCGDVIKGSVIPKLTHDFNGAQEIEFKCPTCNAVGYAGYQCTNLVGYDENGDEVYCSKIQVSRVIARTAHDFNMGELADSPVATAATCTLPATYYYTCMVCGQVDHSQTFAYGDPLGHSFGAWTVTTYPTPTNDGERKRVCTVCGVEETETFKPVVYPFTEGANGSWEKGSTNGMLLVTAADNNTFLSISVDGTVVATKDYDRVSGSTRITLHNDFLETLTDGTHEILASW